MTLLRIIKIKNGDMLENFNYYTCDSCGTELEECWPRIVREKIDYCFDCSFKMGLITEEKYLNSGTGCCYGLCRAAVNSLTNEIEIRLGRGKFSWEKTNKDHRQSPEYTEWRTEVFTRDSYTCKKCGIKGGELNAHHIEHFSKNKKKRFDIDNGITLCIKCHRNEHKNKKVV